MELYRWLCMPVLGISYQGVMASQALNSNQRHVSVIEFNFKRPAIIRCIQVTFGYQSNREQRV